MVGLIVNPVNSVVPAMCELWKKKGAPLRPDLGAAGWEGLESADCEA